jgi:hypothetical protein
MRSRLWMSLFWFSLTFFVGLAFQNCAPAQFEMTTLDQASLTTASSCKDPVPVSTEAIACPTENSNQPLFPHIERRRSVTCVDSQWVIGNWITPPLSSCGCQSNEMLADSQTGFCLCPVGKTVNSAGQCEVPTCPANTKPSEIVTKPCPSGTGVATQTRPVTCNSSSQQWEIGTPSNWNYRGCGCPVGGQNPSPQTGECSCPSGQYQIGGSCGQCPSEHTYNPSTKSCNRTSCQASARPPLEITKLCSDGINNARATCSPSCNSSNYQWIQNCGSWNYSACTCSGGKTLNPSTGACECASGTTMNPNTGQCEVPSCNPATRPPESTSTSCPGGSTGSVSRICRVTCNTSNQTWQQSCDPYNYGSCQCSGGQIANPTTGSCQCPGGQYMIGSQCGTCPANTSYNSSTRTCEKQCTQSEVLMATRSYFSRFTVNTSSVADNCRDGAVPNLADNLPNGSTDITVRFFNTCGNRYCTGIYGSQGYMEGRVVEINGSSGTLECRRRDPPPTVSDSCRQKLLTLPYPIQTRTTTDVDLATTCVDGAVPTVDQNYPSTPEKMVRYIFTCANRWCKKSGFSSGRMIERTGGSVILNCYREEIFNQLQAGTIVTNTTTTIDSVATACIDSANPTKESSYPSVNAFQALRFVNTCGNRYCRQFNLGETGTVTEINNGSVNVSCIK